MNWFTRGKNKDFCPVCIGEGRIIVSKPTGKKGVDTTINERCPICEGKGYNTKDKPKK